MIRALKLQYAASLSVAVKCGSRHDEQKAMPQAHKYCEQSNFGTDAAQILSRVCILRVILPSMASSSLATKVLAPNYGFQVYV